jgi:hypothetical protein
MLTFSLAYGINLSSPAKSTGFCRAFAWIWNESGGLSDAPKQPEHIGTDCIAQHPNHVEALCVTIC